MDALNDFLGIDEQSPSERRALELVERNRQLIDDLIALRKERDLTQAGVAAVLGITQPSIADFERHGSDPKLSTIARYAHAVEALVKFQVEADTGQLFGQGWTPTTFKTSTHATLAERKNHGVEVPATNRRDRLTLAA